MSKRISILILVALTAMTIFAPNADAWKKKYKNGDFYEGKAKWGKPDGECTMQYADGRKYIGSWKNNCRDGKGVTTRCAAPL